MNCETNNNNVEKKTPKHVVKHIWIKNKLYEAEMALNYSVNVGLINRNTV